jgi:hypothetical protein
MDFGFGYTYIRPLQQKSCCNAQRKTFVPAAKLRGVKLVLSYYFYYFSTHARSGGAFL